jgi:hypothetical protein
MPRAAGRHFRYREADVVVTCLCVRRGAGRHPAHQRQRGQELNAIAQFHHKALLTLGFGRPMPFLKAAICAVYLPLLARD